MRSISKKTLSPDSKEALPTHNPDEDDDPIVSVDQSASAQTHARGQSGETLTGLQNSRSVASPSSASRSQYSDYSLRHVSTLKHTLVQPRISVRTEYSSIARPLFSEKGPSVSNITSLVTISLDDRCGQDSLIRTSLRIDPHPANRARSFSNSQEATLSPKSSIEASPLSGTPMSPIPPHASDSLTGAGYAYGATRSTLTAEELPAGPYQPPLTSLPESGLTHAALDLQERLSDWSGSLVKEFGSLQRHGALQIKKDAHT